MEEELEELVENDFEQGETENLASNEEIEELRRRLAENDAIIEELMFRQDSLESNRQKDLERRFEMVMRMVRNETKGNVQTLRKKRKTMF